MKLTKGAQERLLKKSFVPFVALIDLQDWRIGLFCAAQDVMVMKVPFLFKTRLIRA
jgi:hypothetical protein